MKAKQDQIFFAYYDTIEETGEVVYCGKGTNARSEPNIEAIIKINKPVDQLDKNDIFIT